MFLDFGVRELALLHRIENTMLKTAKITAALCIVASSALSGSHSAGDAAKGEKVFKNAKHVMP